MSWFRLLLANVLHYWRTNLAVVLGVAAATAVIGGALIVGDSVRASLRQMSLDRLGQIDHLLTGPRFFREDLSQELQDSHSDVVWAPAIVMQGTVEFGKSSDDAVRAGHIQVYGLDDRAWELLDHRNIAVPEPGELIINQRVAEQLNVAVGDAVTLIVEIPASIPRDALLGDREETVTALELTVSAIAADETGLSRLGFNPTQQLPLNVFVSLGELQQQTGLAAVAKSRRNPEAKPARINTLLISHSGQTSPAHATELTSLVAQQIQLSDLALRLKEHPDRRYLSLESEQMMLERGLSQTAMSVATASQISYSPILVYLLNEMQNPAAPNRHSMYSVVAGIDLATLPAFDFRSSAVVDHLAEDEALVNTWLAEDLDLQAGSTLSVKYHVVGDRGQLPEESHDFEIAAIVQLDGTADDQGFTPEVPGVTDAETYAEWREPFPLKRDRITTRDDEYWDEFRTTPKVFVGLPTAQRLWKSRYGELTSLRLMPAPTQTLKELADTYEQALLSKLTPLATGLLVQPVKHQGLQAAQGTTDFTGLFIGFSFFLILAATMLVGLLFRLGIEQRTRELGLLRAVGFPTSQVRNLFLLEGTLLVILGTLVGTGFAVGYAALMILGLKTWWIGAIGTRFLMLDVQPGSLIAGGLIAGCVALLAIVWAFRQSRGFSTRQLLAGIISDDQTGEQHPTFASVLRAWAPLVTAIALAAITLAGLIPDQEAFGGFSWRVVMFFVVGTMMLWGSLSILSFGLRTGNWGGVSGAGFTAWRRLAVRNAARNRGRSVLTTSLIASAAFVIVAVAAGRQNPSGETPKPHSGNGGYTLVAETNLPLLYDLNTAEGQAKLGFNLADDQVVQTLKQIHVAPFRVQPGENASCLNLYQTTLPTILGVPDDVLQQFIDEHRFAFADTPSANPWELLRAELPDGRIPVLGDMNTLMYSMHVGIGGMVEVPAGETSTGGQLEIAGMFSNSIFQGMLVMTESHFLKLFPNRSGFQYFLIECAPDNAAHVSQFLERQLGDSGFDAERVADRLADFLAVQNTYLSTFQTLGGLGLLLGTIGLATVMLRNVLERRGELALLRAVGLQASDVGQMVLWEHTLLMCWGLLIGSVAALIAMGPHLLTTGADVPWNSITGLLLIVFVVGLLTAIAAIRTAIHTPILSTLRGD